MRKAVEGDAIAGHSKAVDFDRAFPACLLFGNGGEDWNGNTAYSGMPQDAFDSREHDSSEKELVK
jgi:hypothetical protein